MLSEGVPNSASFPTSAQGAALSHATAARASSQSSSSTPSDAHRSSAFTSDTPLPAYDTAGQPPPPSLPSDYHDSYLLARVADCDTDPIDLAAELGIRLELLIDWMSAPLTIKRLNTIVNARQMIEQRQEQAESSRMLDSLSMLHDRAAKAKDHVEQRRAAIAYLRFANRPQSRRGHFGCTVGAAGGGGGGGGERTSGAAHTGGASAASGALSLSRFPERYRTRSRFVRTVPILHEPPAILRPPTTPNPTNTPGQTTIVLLQRLQDSDNPNTGDGLRTLFNHFTPEWRKKVGAATADDFACTEFPAYHALLGHSAAVLQPTVYHPAACADGPVLRATVYVNFVDIDARMQFLTLSFRRTSPTAAWLIDDLQVTSGVEPPPPPASPAPNSS